MPSIVGKVKNLAAGKNASLLNAAKYDFPIHRPYSELQDDEKKIVWNGAKGLKGIRQFFQLLEKENYKVQNRVLLARYRGKNTCPECNGTRLRKEALYVQVGKKNYQ